MYSLDEPLFTDVMLACFVALVLLVVILAVCALVAVECASKENAPTPTPHDPPSVVKARKNHRRRRQYPKCAKSPIGECVGDWKRGRLYCVHCGRVYR